MQVAKPKFRRHQLARPKYRGDQISKAQPKYHRLLLFMRVYLHIEATGLGPEDEAVAMGIVDSSGNVLLDSLVRPQRKTTWPRAQRIHGISPRGGGHGADVARVGPRHPGGRTRPLGSRVRRGLSQPLCGQAVARGRGDRMLRAGLDALCAAVVTQCRPQCRRGPPRGLAHIGGRRGHGGV